MFDEMSLDVSPCSKLIRCEALWSAGSSLVNKYANMGVEKMYLDIKIFDFMECHNY